MGDLNQRIDKHSNVKNKESITNVFSDIKIVTLTKSYRSTYNITMFSKEILNGGEPIEAVERYGDNPRVYITQNCSEEIEEILEKMKASEYQSIAIICKNKESSLNVYNDLKNKSENVNIVVDESSIFNVGVNIIPAYLAKGLEFDGVIIADGENFLGEKDRNLFYTACTRALHELHIISKKDMKNILPDNEELYDIN